MNDISVKEMNNDQLLREYKRIKNRLSPLSKANRDYIVEKVQENFKEYIYGFNVKQLRNIKIEFNKKTIICKKPWYSKYITVFKEDVSFGKVWLFKTDNVYTVKLEIIKYMLSESN